MTSERCLVLVTGTGRSGTSTIAGTLAMLGLHVPEPWFGADETNPKGYYESTWSVRWHKRLTAAAGIHEFDSRPTALERAQSALTDEWRAELVVWLRKQARRHEQVLVKDPRTVWAQRAWKDAAAGAGLDIRYLSMLRHPAEVVSSRTTYYAAGVDDAERRRYETFNVARWVNNSLISEHETRGDVRAFLPYVDLLDDWRSAVERVADDLGLTLPGLGDPETAGEVDRFIDPGLRRHSPTWSDVEVPSSMAATAQAVWEELSALARPERGDRIEQLDALRLGYARLMEEASAIAHDSIEEVRLQTVAQVTAELREQQGTACTKSPLEAVGGRALVNELCRRAVARVGRPLTPRDLPRRHRSS